MASSDTVDVPFPPAPRSEVPSRRRGGVRRVVILATLVAVLLLMGIKVIQFRAMTQAGKKTVPPPEAVATTQVTSAQWQETRSAIGSLVAVRSVVLSTELAGTVNALFFDSGSTVKRGDILVQLDTSIEDAQLKSALAEAELSRIRTNRQRLLWKKNAIPASILEGDEARGQEARAAVEVVRATLAKKSIRAPFDGRTTLRQIELGQTVALGTPVASLASVSPIYAELTLPQQAISELKVGQKAVLRADAFPGRHWEGVLEVINPAVDVVTRNVRMRAVFDNPDGSLLPGMFVKVDILSGKVKQVTALPVTSIVYAPYGDSVFVVEETKDAAGKRTPTVQQKAVRLGERRGDFVAVSGVSPEEQVVSSGAFKLRNGMPVQVNNSLAPHPQLTPTPEEN